MCGGVRCTGIQCIESRECTKRWEAWAHVDDLRGFSSISIHPPCLVRRTFWPTPRAGIEFFSSLASGSRVDEPVRELAGQGRMVDPERLTVMKDAANVATKKVVVAIRRVRMDVFASDPSMSSHTKPNRGGDVMC